MNTRLIAVVAVLCASLSGGPAWGQSRPAAAARPSVAQSVPAEPEMSRESVVKVIVTRRSPDLYQPWTKEAPQELSGSGAIIDGKRILTNSHVVTYASQVYVQGFQSADKVPAKVVAVGHGIDLAILEVSDATFFDKRPPLQFAEHLPQVKDTVNAYGFPVGGTELSVTQGIISRIEFGNYYADVMGLRIQVDAALNPGNSGGPAVSKGKIVGLVFSKMKEGDNIGYLIPVEEIKQFLGDIADGQYDGKPQLFDGGQTVENDALRTKLGLKTGQGGALVVEPYSDAPEYPLKKWDVVIRIGDHEIGSDSRVVVRDDLRLFFPYMVSRLVKDGKVPLTILRDGKELKVETPVPPERDLVIKYLKGKYPRYFIYGPLVFAVATQDFQAGIWERAGGRLVYGQSPLLTRWFSKAAFPGEELVVVTSKMFPHRITKGFDDPFAQVVTEVNGVKIKNLRHLAETLRNLKDEFVVFNFAEKRVEILVFRRAELEAATEEILTDNGIRYQCSPDLRDIWEKE